jgi:hypothetical protein
MDPITPAARLAMHDADLRDLADSRFDLSQSTVLPQHLWVGSGRGGVAPLDTTLGVAGFHTPPVWAPAFTMRVDLLVNGLEILDSPGGMRLPEPGNNVPPNRRALLQRRRSWQLDRIIRIGHVHCHSPQGLISFEITSELAALAEHHGFAMTLTVRNRGEIPLDLVFRDSIDPGAVAALPWSDWVWMPPTPATVAQPVGERAFQAGPVRLHVQWERASLSIPPQEQVSTSVRCLAAVDPAPLPVIAPGTDLVAQTTQRQAQRLRAITQRFPSLTTNHRGLAEYWRRCLVTGVTCLWDHESFRYRPHLATSGIDGRAICTYLWDASYAPWVLHLMAPEALDNVLAGMQNMDVHEHFAFTPDGAGTGPWYSANDHSLTELIWTRTCVSGIDRDLIAFLQSALQRSEDRLPGVGELKDFGTNRNLLEMRTNGYEHVVPCFNSLRALNLRRLATLLDMAGMPGGEAYRQKADRIVREVRKRLWDPTRGWFDCLHPDGSRHHVESIQVFDVMLADVATAGQERALVSRLVEGDFLGPFGVHSVSPRDELHFELVDVDWSGNGAFLGEPTILAYTLWKRGFARIAWQVMQRLLWMGTTLPYLPQETYAGKPMASARGVANQCAALAGIRAILSGMLGLEPRPDGELTLSPQLPPGVEIQLRGLRWGKVVIDLDCRPRQTEVYVNGELRPDLGPGARIRG